MITDDQEISCDYFDKEDSDREDWKKVVEHRKNIYWLKFLLRNIFTNKYVKLF